jgi:tetratricopeptide (TPR) repeat protein
LLAARLDQLDPAERAVLERGSVEGRTFHRGAVAALADGDSPVDERLVALVRKQLVRPDRAQLTGDDAYRFRHLLIRDAAYEALPKASRADLHRRFAAWLEEHGRDLVELEEILGYHLEQAALYLGQLGEDDATLALAAGEHLGLAGRRAAWRGDFSAAVRLLERALALTRPYRLEVHLEAELVRSYELIDVARAVAVADAAAARADEAGDEAGAALLRTLATKMRLQRRECSVDELEAAARAALPLLEARGDDDGLAYVWHALGWVANFHARLGDWSDAVEQALLHAHRAGQPIVGRWGMTVPLTFGPKPADEALPKLDSVIGEQPHPADLQVRAVLLGMLGQVEEAWAVGIPAAERARELGVTSGPTFLGELALIAGDQEAAAEYLRAACADMERRGTTAVLSSYAPLLGRVVCALGDPAEAEQLARKGRELGDPEDVWTQALWRQAQALVLSARGQHDEAVGLLEEALGWWSRTDSLPREGEAHCDLAVVLEAADRREEAIAAWRDALDCYERKKVIPAAARVRERLAALAPA